MKYFNLSQVLILILGAAYLVRQLDALNCYACSTFLGQADCADTFNKNSRYIQPCSTGICAKTKSPSGVVRQCALSCEQGSQVSCCKTELCNSAFSKFNMNSAIGFLSIVVFGFFFRNF